MQVGKRASAIACTVTDTPSWLMSEWMEHAMRTPPASKHLPQLPSTFLPTPALTVWAALRGGCAVHAPRSQTARGSQ